MNHTLHSTPHGVRYALLGSPSSPPGPALLLLGLEIEHMVQPPYCDIPAALTRYGFLTIIVDVPCHGPDRRPDEPTDLFGWLARLKAGENLVADFTRRVSKVLDHLVQEGMIDGERLAAVGISRGGFLALHCAAADARIQKVVALAPVTHLPDVREFAELADHPLTNELDLRRQAANLVERDIWLTISSWDDRVNTDTLIEFTRKVAAAAIEQQKIPRIHLMMTAGQGHGVAEDAPQEAARWLVGQLQPDSQPDREVDLRPMG